MLKVIRQTESEGIMPEKKLTVGGRITEITGDNGQIMFFREGCNQANALQCFARDNIHCLINPGAISEGAKLICAKHPFVEQMLSTVER
ncbi:hypothetical protein A2767_00960 [Candidatus Roizmanbacteria bacterium RIFCSPHIGHO2_01_FULL_35_10]|nr:MAG: hypothetical protein A2767_00960 [Candidatus Roizmanbacteria bacterium RIFCSPHIGHO2_01_FULL_35_10]